MVSPTFFNLSLNLAIRSFWSEPSQLLVCFCFVLFCFFCWLYRASPSVATKNIINLISVLIIWWCPCVEFSFVLFKEGVCIRGIFYKWVSFVIYQVNDTEKFESIAEFDIKLICFPKIEEDHMAQPLALCFSCSCL